MGDFAREMEAAGLAVRRPVERCGLEGSGFFNWVTSGVASGIEAVAGKATPAPRKALSKWTSTQIVGAIRTEQRADDATAALVAQVTGQAYNADAAGEAWKRATPYLRQVISDLIQRNGNTLDAAGKAALAHDPALKAWWEEQVKKAGAYATEQAARDADRDRGNPFKNVWLYVALGGGGLLALLLLGRK